MWYFITDDELDALLSAFVQKTLRLPFSFSYQLFYTLFVHGFRVNELRKVHQWDLVSGTVVRASTLKGSNDRMIPAADFLDSVIMSIEQETNLVYTASYDTYRRYFQANIGVLAIRHKSKNIAMHAFRHNVIKKRVRQGYSYEEVRIQLGIKSLSVLEQYVHSKLEVKRI